MSVVSCMPVLATATVQSRVSDRLALHLYHNVFMKYGINISLGGLECDILKRDMELPAMLTCSK